MVLKCCGTRLPTVPLLVAALIAGYELHDVVDKYVAGKAKQPNALQQPPRSWDLAPAAAPAVGSRASSAAGVDQWAKHAAVTPSSPIASSAHPAPIEGPTAMALPLPLPDGAAVAMARDAALGRVCFSSRRAGQGCARADGSNYRHINLWEAEADCSLMWNCTGVVRSASGPGKLSFTLCSDVTAGHALTAAMAGADSWVRSCGHFRSGAVLRLNIHCSITKCRQQVRMAAAAWLQQACYSTARRLGPDELPA